MATLLHYCGNNTKLYPTQNYTTDHWDILTWWKTLSDNNPLYFTQTQRLLLSQDNLNHAIFSLKSQSQPQDSLGYSIQSQHGLRLKMGRPAKVSDEICLSLLLLLITYWPLMPVSLNFPVCHFVLSLSLTLSWKIHDVYNKVVETSSFVWPAISRSSLECYRNPSILHTQKLRRRGRCHYQAPSDEDFWKQQRWLEVEIKEQKWLKS